MQKYRHVRRHDLYRVFAMSTIMSVHGKSMSVVVLFGSLLMLGGVFSSCTVHVDASSLLGSEGNPKWYGQHTTSRDCTGLTISSPTMQSSHDAARLVKHRGLAPLSSALSTPTNSGKVPNNKVDDKGVTGDVRQSLSITISIPTNFSDLKSAWNVLIGACSVFRLFVVALVFQAISAYQERKQILNKIEVSDRRHGGKGRYFMYFIASAAMSSYQLFFNDIQANGVPADFVLNLLVFTIIELIARFTFTIEKKPDLQ
eukprot:GHVQ01032848.1.p1 GENE.GHVQ01032848.1~~GHVQ01032848.1.p1  ORF type:complete len:257 (+),score=24.51 GHVQ01032848.1:200-970(+)